MQKYVNPYEAPFIEHTSDNRRLPNLLGLLAWGYPLLLVSSFYSTWIIAWISLGHRPRPMRDDPKHIGIEVDIPYLISGLLLIGIPVAVLLGLALQLLVARRSRSQKLLWSLLLIVLWSLTIAFLRWDPWLVGEWYMD
jgi:hypothetical protein